MPKKPRKRTTPKKRDPSWQLRHALGHKVEIDPKAYTRKLKHPEDDETEQSTSNPVLGASDFGAIFGAEKTVKGRNKQCLSMVDCDS